MDSIKDKLLNKEWRMNNLYSVASKEGGKTVKFVPNEAQRVVLEAMMKYKRIIVLKSRQLGITTGITTSFLDDTLFSTNTKALSILQTQQDAMDAFDNKVRFAWDNLDERLKAELGWVVDTERANQLAFNFGGGMSSKYSVATSGRSGTFQRVHVSEFGTLCAERPLDAKEVITGTFPAVPQDGLIIIESTANGELGYFPQMWNDAVLGRNNFYPIFLNWRYDTKEIAKAVLHDVSTLPKEFQDLQVIHKLTDQETSYYYAQWLTYNRDWALLRQEFPTTAQEAFQGSGDKLFDIESLQEYEAQAEDGIKAGNTTIYTKPQEGHLYVIGADPSEGNGNDHSACCVWDISTPRPKVVAIYSSNTATPDDFSLILKELAVRYNSAVIAVERNNHGHAVISKLRSIYDEERLYSQVNEVRIKGTLPTQYGFLTTATTKGTILSSIVQAIRDKDILVTSKQLLLEMRLAPKREIHRIKGNEETTNHFDLLMASAIGLYARSFALENFGSTKESSSVEDPIFQIKPPSSFDPYSPI